MKQTRRERLRELAQMDAAQRCCVCKRPLVHTIEWLDDPRKFCSMDCVETARQRAELEMKD